MSTAEPLADGEDFIQLASSSDEEEQEETEEDQWTEDEDERETLPNGKRGASASASASASTADAKQPSERCYNGHPLPPWLKGHKRLGKGKWPEISDMINEEMTHFVKYISPTPEEHQMREWVIARMQR
ncbi:hypothetical protein GGI23_005384, partial [Coemansia sp. RSA 2559]